MKRGDKIDEKKSTGLKVRTELEGERKQVTATKEREGLWEIIIKKTKSKKEMNGREEAGGGGEKTLNIQPTGSKRNAGQQDDGGEREFLMEGKEGTTDGKENTQSVSFFYRYAALNTPPASPCSITLFSPIFIYVLSLAAVTTSCIWWPVWKNEFHKGALMENLQVCTEETAKGQTLLAGVTFCEHNADLSLLLSRLSFAGVIIAPCRHCALIHACSFTPLRDKT